MNKNIEDNSYLSFSWRLIKSYKSFIATSSLGQIVDGYSMIWPLKHIKCLQQLSEAELFELDICVNELIVAINNAYNIPVAIFEHGLVTSSTEVGCGVNHAHLHFAPFLLNDFFYEKLKSYLVLKKQFKTIFDFYASSEKINDDYVLISNNNHDCSVYSYKDKRISQIIRKIIAELIGNSDNWNWKDDLDYLSVKNAAEKISYYY